MERRQLDSIFISLRTGVNEKKRIIIVAADLTETLSEILLNTVYNGVRVKTDFMELFFYFCDVVRVRMSDRNDSNASSSRKAPAALRSWRLF